MADAFAWVRSHLGRSASVTRCPACTVSKGPPVATAGLAFAACQVRQPACHTTCAQSTPRRGVRRARATSRPGVSRLPHPSWTRGYVPACAQSAASARRISHGQRGPGPRECRERGPAGLGNLAGRNASSVPRLHSPHGALTWSTRPPRRLPARACPTPRPGSRNARSEDKADAAENLLSRALPVCSWRAKCLEPFLKKKKKWKEEVECAKVRKTGKSSANDGRSSGSSAPRPVQGGRRRCEIG